MPLDAVHPIYKAPIYKALRKIIFGGATICYSDAMHAPVAYTLVEPEMLMLAYRTGVFPMADSRDDPDIFWIEPRIRAILPFDCFHLSRSLARTLRRGRFEVTCNTAFGAVMDACAAARPGDETESWISHRIQASYENLHRHGYAHSIECWQTAPDGERALVGGLYGVGFDRVFCGESMFSRVRDASKVALAWLVAAMRQANAELLDCQFLTEHLASLGAVEITQASYLELLKEAQRPYSGGAAPLSLPEAFSALVAGAGPSSPGKLIAQALTQTS